MKKPVKLADVANDAKKQEAKGFVRCCLPGFSCDSLGQRKANKMRQCTLFGGHLSHRWPVFWVANA